jgi:hypothetical protein
MGPVHGERKLQFRAACAGLIGSAAWSAYLLVADGVRLEAARGRSLANVVGFASILVSISLLGGWRGREHPSLDRAVTILGFVVWMQWLQATGSWSSPLLPVPLLLVFLHRRVRHETGLVACAAAAVCHSICFAIEALGVLPYAPVYDGVTPPASGTRAGACMFLVLSSYVAAGCMTRSRRETPIESTITTHS